MIECVQWSEMSKRTDKLEIIHVGHMLQHKSGIQMH